MAHASLVVTICNRTRAAAATRRAACARVRLFLKVCGTTSVAMEQKLNALLEKPVVRGLMGRCPHCGEGKMFRAFLKVADNCPACGEEFFFFCVVVFLVFLVFVFVG